MTEDVKPNPPRGKPRIAVVGSDGHGGLRASYFEDDLLEVPVPEWVDPRGYQEMPSSVALPMLLGCIQRPNLFSRRPESAKRRRKRLKKTLKNLVRTMQESASRHELNDAVRATKAMHNYPTEKLRATALAQFASLNLYPIARQRWHEVEPVLLKRAERSGRSASAEVADAVKAAAPQVRLTSSPERSVEANLRQQLNDLVTEDILDSKKHKFYDRKSRLRMQPTEECALATLAEAERSRGQLDHEDGLLEKIAREEFLDELRTGLSSRERELLDVCRRRDDYRKWAKTAWGCTDSTVDNTMNHLRRKGRELARKKNLL